MGHHLFKCTTAIKPACFFMLVFESWLSLENQSCDMLSHVQFDITDMPYFKILSTFSLFFSAACLLLNIFISSLFLILLYCSVLSFVFLDCFMDCINLVTFY